MGDLILQEIETVRLIRVYDSIRSQDERDLTEEEDAELTALYERLDAIREEMEELDLDSDFGAALKDVEEMEG